MFLILFSMFVWGAGFCKYLTSDLKDVSNHQGAFNIVEENGFDVEKEMHSRIGKQQHKKQ